MTPLVLSRRLRMTALIVGVVLALPAAALASWPASSGDGVGGARARAMGSPEGVTASPTSSTSITISWTAPTGGAVPPDSYRVNRTAPSAHTVCTTASLSCVDSGLSAATNYSYSVVALRGDNWASAGASASAATPSGSTPNFLVELVAATDKTAGTAFDVRVTARQNTATDTSYTGHKTLSFTGPGDAPSGTVPAYPTAVTFTNGIATTGVTLYKAEAATLEVTDETRSGSVEVTVGPAASNRLRFTGSSVECGNGLSGSTNITKGTAWTSKVSLADLYGNLQVNGAIEREVGLSEAGDHTNASPSTLVIPANANPGETSNETSVTAHSGNNKVGTVTATSSGLTSATCTLTTPAN